MPKQQLTLTLKLPPSSALQTFQRAASQLGWQIVSCSNSELVCQELTNTASMHWPAKVSVIATANGAGTQVTLNGTIAGFGPIQSSHLKKQMESLVEMVSRESGGSLTQSTKIERSLLEKLGDPINQFTEEFFGHEQFVNQLLNMPLDQMQYVLMQKVQGMDHRAFNGFYWSLIGMYLVKSGRAQNLASVFQSRKSWGNTFEDAYAQFEAEMNYGGPSPQQRWESLQMQKQADVILMLAGYAKQFRK